MSKFYVNDLIERKLVRSRKYDNGLSVIKYHNKVFYNNLWDEDIRLLDCRGTVVDSESNIVTMPFTKLFNYNENGKTINEKEEVIAIEKANGFMAALSFFNGEPLVSTTGTIDSEYAKLASSVLGDKVNCINQYKNCTLLFEICHDSDPHIVKEDEGAYLIGARFNRLGSEMMSERHLDEIAIKHGFKRPKWSKIIFGDLLQELKSVKHEGFVVRSTSGCPILKLKSPHYLTTKFFARMGKSKLLTLKSDADKFKKNIDEEYYDLLDHIKTIDEWSIISEQSRIKIIEEFLKCQR